MPPPYKMLSLAGHDVIQMPDREDMIASLKARIEAGTYHVSGADIADAMARRAIADRVR